MPGSALQTKRAAAAVARAHQSGDPDAIVASRRDLAVAKLTQYIERVISQSPALTDSQRAKLSSLLAGGAE